MRMSYVFPPKRRPRVKISIKRGFLRRTSSKPYKPKTHMKERHKWFW